MSSGRRLGPLGVGRRAAPQTVATPAPAVKRLGARSAEPRVQHRVVANRLTDRRRNAWPGSGHARTPPPGAPDGHHHHGKPTSRQLAYLKSLADRTGQTFTYPQTSRQASAEINRLKHAQPSSRTERYVERKLIADQIATGPLDAARVRDDEISGRGSSATWMHNREQEPPPVEDPGPAAPRRRRAPVVGQRTELARYTVTEGERILYGQRIDGIVRVTDRPAAPGRPRLPRRTRTGNQERARRPDRRLPPTGHQARQPAPGRLPAGKQPGGQRMSHSNPLILQVHLAGAEPYEIGDEIWQQSLADAIRAEAETIADYAGPDLLPLPGRAGRVALRDRVIAEMTAALRQAGDTYTAPDGIAYTLTDQAQLDLPAREDTLAPMSPAQPAPIVEEVLRFEDLPRRIIRHARRDRALERRHRKPSPGLVRRRDPHLRRRPARQDPRPAPVPALPPRPRLAAVLATSDCDAGPVGAHDARVLRRSRCQAADRSSASRRRRSAPRADPRRRRRASRPA